MSAAVTRDPIQLHAGDAANEMALIAAAMLDPDHRAHLCKEVRPDHFLVETHRHIWAAILEIERRELDYDHVLLERHPGVPAGYAAKLLQASPDVPARGNLEEAVRTLKWDHQRALAIKGPIMSLLEALRDPPPPPERLRGIAQHVATAFDGAGADAFEFMSAVDLAKPLPPHRYLLKHFGFRAGRPNLLAGFGGIGKTVLAEDLTIAVAAGRPTCWGGVEVSLHGAVHHLDYEMGREPTMERYQRLTRGLGVDLAGLAERLRVSCYPRTYLSDDGAEHEMARLCDGVALMIVDSLAAATATNGKGENDSGVRRYLDRLARVSDRTGTVIVVLVHEGKQGEHDRPQLQKVRGHSGIIDAAGNVVSVSSHNGVLRLTHTKPSMGRAGADIYVAIEDGPVVEGTLSADVEDWAARRVPLRVVSAVQPTKPSPTDGLRGAMLEALRGKTLGYEEVLAAVRGNRQVKQQVLRDLRASALVVEVAGKLGVADALGGSNA